MFVLCVAYVAEDRGLVLGLGFQTDDTETEKRRGECMWTVSCSDLKLEPSEERSEDREPVSTGPRHKHAPSTLHHTFTLH